MRISGFTPVWSVRQSSEYWDPAVWFTWIHYRNIMLIVQPLISPTNLPLSQLIVDVLRKERTRTSYISSFLRRRRLIDGCSAKRTINAKRVFRGLYLQLHKWQQRATSLPYHISTIKHIDMKKWSSQCTFHCDYTWSFDILLSRICVSFLCTVLVNWVIIGSGNGSPDRVNQLNRWWPVVNWNFTKNLFGLFFQNNAFENVVWKIVIILALNRFPPCHHNVRIFIYSIPLSALIHFLVGSRTRATLLTTSGVIKHHRASKYQSSVFNARSSRFACPFVPIHYLLSYFRR